MTDVNMYCFCVLILAHGTGSRKVRKWKRSAVTQHFHKLVIPDESPDKKV